MSRGLAKRNGDALEADVIAVEPSLVGVSDGEAEWMDARTISLLEPSTERPLGSICLLEAGTPVEIKSCQLLIQRRSDSKGPGQWYIKRRAHEQLLDAAGAYYLVVYQNGDAADADDLEILRRLIIPASIMDELITSWSNPGAGRDEKAVARVPWSRIWERDELEEDGADAGDASAAAGGEPA